MYVKALKGPSKGLKDVVGCGLFSCSQGNPGGDEGGLEAPFVASSEKMGASLARGVEGMVSSDGSDALLGAMLGRMYC